MRVLVRTDKQPPPPEEIKDSKDSPTISSIANSPQRSKTKGSKKTLLLDEPSPSKIKLKHCMTSIVQNIRHNSGTPMLSAQLSLLKPVKANENIIESEEDLLLQNKLIEVNVLSIGSSFGELALLSNKPRAATIICREECDFAVLEKEDFRKILKYSEEKKLLEEMNFFASLTMFRNWNFNLVKMLYVNTQTRVCGLREIVYEEGQEGDEMFIVQNGTFVVKKSLKLKNFYNLKKWGGMKELFSNDYKYRNIEMIKVLLNYLNTTRMPPFFFFFFFLPK